MSVLSPSLFPSNHCWKNLTRKRAGICLWITQSGNSENNGGKPIIITGDRVSLKHAFAEIMLNALQANVKEPKVVARLQIVPDKFNASNLQRLKFRTTEQAFFSGSGAEGAVAFFTTRNVGLGLHLTVKVEKSLESHRGCLEILPPQPRLHGIVRVSLPLESALPVM